MSAEIYIFFSATANSYRTLLTIIIFVLLFTCFLKLSVVIHAPALVTDACEEYLALSKKVKSFFFC